MRSLVVAALLTAAFGCEPELPPTPVDLTEDSDGDGLTDHREARLGTDPYESDSDSDGYSDRDEVFEGTNPLRARDRIYEGRWPYYYEKTSLSGGQTFGLFRRFAPLELTDQFGDTVHLWDFHDDDVPVLVQVVAEYCLYDVFTYALPDPLRAAADAGDLRLVTILPSTYTIDGLEDAASDDIPTLEDPDELVNSFLGNRDGWPVFVLLTPDLIVQAFSEDGTIDAVVDITLRLLEEEA